MTEYIFGARQSGKTTKLIRRSDETGAYILEQWNLSNHITTRSLLKRRRKL